MFARFFKLLMARFKYLVMAIALTSLATQALALQSNGVAIPEGTEIEIELAEEVTSGTHPEGETVSLVVAEDVTVDGSLIIAKKTPVIGVIDYSKRGARLGRNGTLSLKIDSTRTVDGRVIKLGGSYIVLGSCKRAATTFLKSVFARLGLFDRGKDARISTGTRLRAYVAGEKEAISKEPITCHRFAAPDGIE